MDQEGNEEREAEGEISTNQLPNETPEQEITPKNSNNQSSTIKKSATEKEDNSNVSVSNNMIIEEFNEMYAESEESEDNEAIEEEVEQEEIEEESYEEEDLSEFRTRLEETYMKDVEFSEVYLEKENKKIEDVPLQLYAIETYINSVRTFYGYANHWIRVKVFDSPCFEIRAYNKVDMHASMYANRSLNQSRGSIFGNRNHSKTDLVETEILSQRRKELENKRLDMDLNNMSEKERGNTIARLMREEVTRGGPDYFTSSTLKVQSKEKDVGLDIPMVECLDEKEAQVFPPEERRGSKVWILREPVECGKTIMFPMRPAQMIHQLQRFPLQLFVLSTSGMMSSGTLELSGLTEAVIRASKGPPYPISSTQRFKSITTGDFTAKIVGIVRVIAIGPQSVTTINCENNPNDKGDRPQKRRDRLSNIEYNMDSPQLKPSIITGPQKFTLCDLVKNIRARKQKDKFKMPPEPSPKRYYVEDLVFNRAKNTVCRAPKKTFASLRAEIDRYLVLNRKYKKGPKTGSILDEESIETEGDSVGERSTIHDEGEEELEMEGEEEQLEDEETAQRVEAVFQSLIQVYGQNWANYKPKASSSSSASLVNEQILTAKRDDSKNSVSSSAIWKRFQSTTTPL